MIKERYQNPAIGDCLKLQLFVYNNNARTDVYKVKEVQIYAIETPSTCCPPDGGRLVETIDGSKVCRAGTGLYNTTITLTSPKYGIGNYSDVWVLELQEGSDATTVDNKFNIYPSLWHTSPLPVVYDFNFEFSPNRLRKGEKRWIRISVTPNIPSASDLNRYYENLLIVSPLTISIEQACGSCMPQEQDLRLIVDKDPVSQRDRGQAYYLLDTADFDCGIYNVWFEMDFGESHYISTEQALQIF